MKLEEIVKTVEDAFQNPQYVNAKIRYVKSKEEADVCVSRNHTMSDYIVLGAFALFNSIEGKKSELKVYTQKDLKKGNDRSLDRKYFLQRGVCRIGTILADV